MKPTFFKELSLTVRIQGKPELVGFSAGFSKSVDPLSGMTVNLRDILLWQDHWKNQIKTFEFLTWLDFLQQARTYFLKAAEALQAPVELVVQLRFFDSSTLRWDGSEFIFTMRAPLSDSVERLRVLQTSFSLENDSDLSRLQNFEWPERFPGSFEELELIRAYFESRLGLAPKKIEILDPETNLSLVMD